MRKLLITATLTICSLLSFAQNTDKFNLTYVASDYIDTINKKSVIVVLGVTPINKKDFPPILSMKFSYKVNDETTETALDILNQEEKKVAVVVYGNEINEKAPKVYELIKDRFDLNPSRRIWLLGFYIQNISDDPIERLSIKYGLWEKRNQNKRDEKIFEFNIRE